MILGFSERFISFSSTSTRLGQDLQENTNL
jgi:hypothetical protein